MRTTAIIAALVFASVGAPAQADYQSDYFDFDPPKPKPKNEAPIVLPFSDGSCRAGYTKRGSFCVPPGGGGQWIAIPAGEGLPGKR
jgi:hypothetical protein